MVAAKVLSHPLLVNTIFGGTLAALAIITDNRLRNRATLPAKSPSVPPVSELPIVKISSEVTHHRATSEEPPEQAEKIPAMARRKSAKSSKPKEPVKAVKIRLKAPTLPAKRKTPEPEPEPETQTLDLSNAERTLTVDLEPVLKKPKEKKEPDYLYLLKMEVSVGEGKNKVVILDEASEHSAHPEKHTFNFQQETEKEIRLIERYAERRGGLGLAPLRSSARADVTGGKVTLGREIEGPSDWDQIERIVCNFVKQKKTGIAVRYLINYEQQERALEEDNETDADTVLSGESETEQLGVRRPAVRKKRMTATEKEKQREEIDRRKSINYIPALMSRWRCCAPKCSEFNKNACLVLPGEQCRPLNHKLLGQWDDEIKRGNATVEAWPISKYKLPPTKEERSLNAKERKFLQSPLPTTPLPPPTQMFFGLPGFNQMMQSSPLGHSAAPAPRGSSPLCVAPSDTPESLLEEYFEWFLLHYGGSEERREKICEARTALQKEYEDLEGIRKMKEEG